MEWNRGDSQLWQTVLECGNAIESCITRKMAVNWNLSKTKGTDLWLSELVVGGYSKPTGRWGIIENAMWVNLGVMGGIKNPFQQKKSRWWGYSKPTSYFWLKIACIIRSNLVFWLMQPTLPSMIMIQSTNTLQRFLCVVPNHTASNDHEERSHSTWSLRNAGSSWCFS